MSRKTDEQSLWRSPLLRRTLMVCLAVVLVVAGIEGFRRVEGFGQQQRRARLARATLTIRLANAPAWPDRGLADAILREAEAFAADTVPLKGPRAGYVTNYDRLCDPTLDRMVDVPHADVLRELAEYYAAHAAEHSNAWMSCITAVRRTYVRARNQQIVEIAADFRSPVALVAQGSKYYLVDEEGVRLPGEYTQADANNMLGHVLAGVRKHVLLMLRGVDAGVPAPGAAFKSDDFVAGLKLIDLLATQPYAVQIAAVNVANFGGRISHTDPYITLNTIFAGSGPNGATSIYWGRPLGDEKFYEVQPSAKLAALTAIFQQYGRIDAGRAYVDIRCEQPKVPTLATKATSAAPAGDAERGRT